jgi:formylglycine-generating enzyme required for sulfatase activity
MHDLPRQKLVELLTLHGFSLCDDAKKLEGLLKDVLRNECKRETFVLISALREGVAQELLGSKSGMPAAALAAKLARQLCDNLALDEVAAQWSVESWAVALGVKITSLSTVPQKPATSVIASPRTTSAAVSVDLAALALHHRENARQKQVEIELHRIEAAKAATLASQRQEEEKARTEQLELEARANAVCAQKQAIEFAEKSRDFETAVQLLEEIDPKWRNRTLFKKMSDYRDRVSHLNATIHDAVHKGRISFLRSHVRELLKLQPRRDDMRRLLEVLPDEPEVARELTNAIGMKFLLICPGEFTMGSKAGINETPPHRVEITQPFYLGIYPVTQAEYRTVIGTNPSHFVGDPRLPVENVDWNAAVSFGEALTQSHGKDQPGMRYCLPTEAEWEYACRASSTSTWCFGDDEKLLYEYAWFDKNSRLRTHPVGERKPNVWGLHDMHGNIWEWCQDGYDASAYERRRAMPQDPCGTGRHKVCRGGAWQVPAQRCRSAAREYYNSTFRDYHTGFRLVLRLPGQP